MCGITGIAGKTTYHKLLPDMVDRIAHRGPDGKGTWSNGFFSLGHLRLSIIDLTDRASQPMVCSVSGNCLSFNGEIYNYREIKAELEGQYPFQSDSDTEVLLAAYLIWGTDAFSKFRGMYAFALLDQKKQQLLLARDRFGIKPLYYRQEKDALLFSSEIKGLINLEGLSHSPNLLKIYGFVAHRHLDTDTDTFFNEVKQLPAASYAWVDQNGLLAAPVIYWQPPMPGTAHFEEADKERFRAALTDSVRLHLRADVPVASFVSGGLDSSTIASLAYQILGEDYQMQTYSSVLKEKNEENELIEVMQQQLKKASHHGPMLDGSNFLEELPLIMYHHDEPLADASMYAHWELCKLARQNNVKVMLSGNGGDEVLAGYASYVYALLGRFTKNLRLQKLCKYAKVYAKNRDESVYRLLAHAIYEALPMSVREAAKRRTSKQVGKLLNFDLSGDYSFYPFKNADPYESNYLNNLKAWTIPPFLHYEDRNSMAFGIEIRVPMLDHVFLEFVNTFKPEDVLNGRTKQLLRSSMRGFVPDQVLDQKKKFGFAAPLYDYIIIDTENTYRFFKQQIEGVPFIQHANALLLAEKALNEKDKESLMYFWRILSVSVWYKIFFND